MHTRNITSIRQRRTSKLKNRGKQNNAQKHDKDNKVKMATNKSKTSSETQTGREDSELKKNAGKETKGTKLPKKNKHTR